MTVPAGTDFAVIGFSYYRGDATNMILNPSLGGEPCTIPANGAVVSNDPFKTTVCTVFGFGTGDQTLAWTNDRVLTNGPAVGVIFFSGVNSVTSPTDSQNAFEGSNNANIATPVLTAGSGDWKVGFCGATGPVTNVNGQTTDPNIDDFTVNGVDIDGFYEALTGNDAAYCNNANFPSVVAVILEGVDGPGGPDIRVLRRRRGEMR